VSGDRTRSKADGGKSSDIALSIEDLFAEAVAAVESISSGEITLDAGDTEPSMELDVEVSLPEVDPEPSIQEESRAQEARAARRAKLKGRLTELERARDEAMEESETLRAEVIRLKATNQRLRERLDRLQSQNDTLEDARQSAEQQAIRYRDAHRNAADDLSHFQERRRQELTELKLHGQAPAIIATLPVLDHLQLAIEHAGAEPEKIVQGVEMVISQFHGVLRRLGVQRIDCEPGSPFQPELHDAMMHTPTDAIPVGHIVQEISAGYSLNGRLIRAARVSVAAAPSQTTMISEPSIDAPLTDIDTEPEFAPAQEEHLFTIPPDQLEE
jgi:molecular chaperone GrpE